MKKFAVICGLLAMCAFVGCDDDKDSSNGGSNGGGSSSGGIVQVPAGQNNTVGAACNYETFVESCDGNKVIYCGESEDGSEVVKVLACQSACIITEAGKLNYADCAEKYTEVCSAEGQVEYSCETDLYDILGLVTYKCQKWSDGKLHWSAVESEYCSSCTESANGCVKTTCTGDSSACTDDVQGQMCIDGMLFTVVCDMYDDEAMCDTDEYGVYCL